MSMYDIVNVTCPHCARRNVLQTKSGSCDLNEYDESDVPTDVVGGILGDHTCEHCKQPFNISARTALYVKRR